MTEARGEPRVLFVIDSGLRKGIPWPVRVFCEVSESDWNLIRDRLQTIDDDCSLCSDVIATECPITMEDIKAVVLESKDVEKYKSLRHTILHTFNLVLENPTYELLGVEPPPQPSTTTVGKKKPLVIEEGDEDDDDDESSSGVSEYSAGSEEEGGDEDESSSASDQVEEEEEEEDSASGSCDDSEEAMYKYKVKAMKIKNRRLRREIKELRAATRKMKRTEQEEDDADGNIKDTEEKEPVKKKQKRH